MSRAGKPEPRRSFERLAGIEFRDDLLVDKIANSRIMRGFIDRLEARPNRERTERARAVFLSSVNSFLDDKETDHYCVGESPGRLRHIDIKRNSPGEVAMTVSSRESMVKRSSGWFYVTTRRLSIHSDGTIEFEEARTNVLAASGGQYTDFSPDDLLERGIHTRDVYPDTEGDPQCRSGYELVRQVDDFLGRLQQ
jgi:hypothetical protein